MIRGLKRLAIAASCLAVTATGCSFQGVNSLPLPGAVGRGPDAVTYHIEVPNVATLESNSPVMISDVIVGSVGKMTVRDWHADVEISVKPDVVVPGNAVATVGQTSLLGSMHLALNPPLGEKPTGALKAGAGAPTLAVAAGGTAVARSTANALIATSAAMVKILIGARMQASIGSVHQLWPSASSTLAAVRICGSIRGAPLPV